MVFVRVSRIQKTEFDCLLYLGLYRNDTYKFYKSQTSGNPRGPCGFRDQFVNVSNENYIKLYEILSTTRVEFRIVNIMNVNGPVGIQITKRSHFNILINGVGHYLG